MSPPRSKPSATWPAPRKAVPGLVHPDWAPQQETAVDEPEELRWGRDLCVLAIREHVPAVLDDLVGIAKGFRGDRALLNSQLADWAKRWQLTVPWMLERARGIVERWSGDGPDDALAQQLREERAISCVASAPGNLSPLTIEPFDAAEEAVRAAAGRAGQIPHLLSRESGWAAYEARARESFEAFLQEQRNRVPGNAVPKELERNVEWLVRNRLAGISLGTLAHEYAPDSLEPAAERANVSKAVTRTAKFIGWPKSERAID